MLPARAQNCLSLRKVWLRGKNSLIEIPLSVAIVCATYLYAQRIRLRAEFDAKQAATSIAQLRSEIESQLKVLTERTEEQGNKLLLISQRLR